MINIFIAILGGVTIVITRITNSHLANEIGIFQGTLINYIVGIIFSIFFLLISNDYQQISVFDFTLIPAWAYLGGLLGVIVIVLQSYLTPKISAFCLTLLMFIGQLFVGIIIDFFTLNEISLGKLIGGLLILIGFTYNLFVDKKNNKCCFEND